MFETFIKRILHIKEMVWCFVLDGSPRSHASVVKEESILGCSCGKRGIARGHRLRITLLEIGVLGFQRVIQQPYSTNLTPLDFVYVS